MTTEDELRVGRADVVVIGGGLAGLSCALQLTREGADPVEVVILEARTIGWASGSAGADGVIFRGLNPDPIPVIRAIGRDPFRASMRLATAGVEALERTVEERGIDCGFRRVTTRRRLVPPEGAPGVEYLVAASTLLQDVGFECDRDVDDLLVGGDAVVDGRRLVEGLAAAARRRGVRLYEESEVRTIVSLASDHVRVETAVSAFEAARIVLAPGAGLVGFDDWTRSISIAARAQSLRTEPVPTGQVAPISRGPGYAVARQDASGSIRVGEGCQPSNRGDPHAAAPEPTAQAALDRFLRELTDGEVPVVVERGARPLLYTCDGLPLVGPHPGRAGCLLAAGFNGQDLVYGTLAGQMAAEWITDGRPSTADARLFSPRRML